MAITSEILERYKKLKRQLAKLKLFNALSDPKEDNSNVNYRELHHALNSQVWGYDENGVPKLYSGFAGFVLEGSSRSGKTFSGVDLIIYLTTEKHKADGCKINIYRETYNEFKDTLYDDFNRRLPDYHLPNKFKDAQEVKSFRIGKSTINFLGDGKHGGGCDYAFFNEAMMQRQVVFDQVEMRCRKFWWMDYNPSFTTHWIFDNVLSRPDVGFLRTTFKDNPFISAGELNKILGYEPWEPDSYYVENSVLMYEGELITEKHRPPPHPTNVTNGTADEFMWKVYGLGLRGAMKGVIYPNVVWIDEFPNDLDYIYGLDFGFTVDPSALGKYSRWGNNIYWEPLWYSPTPNAEEMNDALEACGVSQYAPIIADSSDKYTSEKHGTVQMVKDLFEIGWEIRKVSKTKGVMFWIGDTKKYKIHIVRSKNPEIQKAMQREQENYKMKEVQGIPINQPIDKFDHFFNGFRYAHMGWEMSIDSAEYS